MTEGWRVHEWGGPLRWDEWEIPGPGPGEVQIQVEACGVGLTVLNNLRGENLGRPGDAAQGARARDRGPGRRDR